MPKETEVPMQTIEDRLREMIPQMTEQVAFELRARALREMESTVVYQINNAVKEYIAEALVPHVKAELAKHEAAFRAAMQAGIGELAVALGAKIVEQGKAKLAGYDGEKLINEIMKNVYGRGY